MLKTIIILFQSIYRSLQSYRRYKESKKAVNNLFEETFGDIYPGMTFDMENNIHWIDPIIILPEKEPRKKILNRNRNKKRSMGMKINSSHKEYVREQLEKNRESKYIIKSLIHKGLSKCQAANCVKRVKNEKRKVNR